VHEYLDEALQSVFSDVLKTAPELIAIRHNTLAYIEKVIDNWKKQ